MKLRERYQLLVSGLIMVTLLTLITIARYDFVSTGIGLVLSCVLGISVRTDKELINRLGNVTIQ